MATQTTVITLPPRQPALILSLLFNIAAAPGGRGTVGGRAHRSSLREDTDPKQNVARIVSPNTGSAGGKGSLGREGHPLAVDVSVAGGTRRPGAYAARLYR